MTLSATVHMCQGDTHELISESYGSNTASSVLSCMQLSRQSWHALQGAWLWGWKDRIDRQWMDKYGKDLAFDSMRGSMGRPGKQGALSMDAEAVAALSAAKMRCGGCGSKA